MLYNHNKQIMCLMGNIDELCVFLKCFQSLQVIWFYWESSSISDTSGVFVFFFLFSLSSLKSGGGKERGLE